MPTAILASPAVSDFAAAVRAALSDLNPDEVDDLTDGLEADLTDRLADGDAAELGDPAAYAEELRGAAGLPHRATGRRGVIAVFTALRTGPGMVAHDVRSLVARTPWLARFAAFLVSLRPAWWVLRAILVTEAATLFFGGAPVNGFSAIFGVVAVIVSVQFGRGKWLPFAWMKALLLAANIILAVATPFVIASWTWQLNDAASAQQYVDESSGFPDASGLTSNGNQVTNIFAYDAQGNPLTDVQLYDQDGKPLDVSGDPTAPNFGDGQHGILVPNQDVPGRLGWNVYPLGHVSADDLTSDGAIKHSVKPTPAKLPFAQATPLAGSEPAPTPTPTSTPAP